MSGTVMRRRRRARVVGNIKDECGRRKDEINGVTVCF
jgi:hypothetical protein